MKPIKVSIKDFQSIDSLDLEISGFTCVTGPSNVGKSAMIRAISSAILNKSVVGSVRKGKKFCSVEVDGLKWEKGDRVGRYWVPGETDESGQPKPRDGIGQGQTEVTELMGFRSVKVGDEYINPWLATQFNPIFLMQNSGPAVTDFISDISHLSVLQDAIVHCTKNRQRLLAASKEKEEELSRLTGREAALSALDNLLVAERDLVQQLESLEAYGRAIGRLRHFIAAIDAEQAAVASLSRAKEVRVPKAPVDPGDSLRPLARLLADIEAAAMRVSPIKGAMKASVPDPYDTGVIDGLERASRFLSIPSLASSLALLDGITAVVVPPPPGDGVLRLRKVARMASEASSLRASVERLSAEVPELPATPAPSSIPGLAAVARLGLQIDEARASVAGLEARAEAVCAELASVEAELAKIPTCPTCRQVFVQPHGHA